MSIFYTRILSSMNDEEKRDKLLKLISKANRLWDKQDFDFGEKYSAGMWLDGEFPIHNIYIGGLVEIEEYVDSLLNHILDKITLLNESKNNFEEYMEEKGDKWKEHISDELAELPKEQVIKNFNSEYIALLSDYTRLYKNAEKLLKE